MTYDVVHIEAHQLLTEEDKADSHVGDVLHFHCYQPFTTSPPFKCRICPVMYDESLQAR